MMTQQPESNEDDVSQLGRVVGKLQVVTVVLLVLWAIGAFLPLLNKAHFSSCNDRLTD